MMKKTLLGLLTGAILLSCSGDKKKEISIDFELKVVGEAPNAKVQITNSTQDADNFEWSFSEGSSQVLSTEKEPSVTVDKTGEFEVKLIASNGDGNKELTKKIEISGNNAILTYEDLEFALDKNNNSIGCLYSFEDQKMYKLSEVNNDNASKIDLGFGSMSNTMYFFVSLADDWFGFSEAPKTQVVNYESTPSVTVSDFEAMEDDAKLSVLTITGTNDSFGNSEIPGTVLFELASGKKGIIKTKAVNSDRILVDIKIQKY